MTYCKPCGKCKQIKTAHDFNKNSSKKDGLGGECRACANANSRKYYLANREKSNAYSRSYRLANLQARKSQELKYRATRKTEKAIYNHSYNKARKAEISVQKRKYYATHKVEKAAYDRAYEKAHPEADLKRKHSRRVLKSGNGTFRVTAKDLLRIRLSSCVYCGDTGTSQVDHVIPIAKGGTHGIGNLQPLCASCNRAKSDSFYAVFKARQQKKL
jgi:5-methylcytosine-specific restriction endonuclease McrA